MQKTKTIQGMVELGLYMFYSCGRQRVVCWGLKSDIQVVDLHKEENTSYCNPSVKAACWKRILALNRMLSAA